VMRKALVLSIGIHAALFGAVRPLVTRAAAATPATDSWAGQSADLPSPALTGAMYDVSIDTPAPPAAPSPPELAAPPLPAPPAVPEPAHAPAVIAVEQEHARRAPQKPAPEPSPAAAAAPAPPKRKPASGAAPVAGAAAHHASAAKSSGGSAGAFGAEGPPSVRSLGRAFLRAIPVASQQDPIWASAALGETGKLTAVIHVDEGGHVSSAEPRGLDPPKPLVSLLRRTVPLLEAGTFAIRGGEVAAGDEVLEIRATVGEAAEGAGAGSPVSLSHDAEKGTAAFTQANGRHVEVAVRVVRIDAR